MIIGIGFDLCDVSRIESLLQNERFLVRFFSSEEQDYINTRGPGKAASAAGCFAAKEALVKALGTGFDGISLKDVTVLHGENGQPYYELRGLARIRADNLGVSKIHLSLSHEKTMAGAFCILEGDAL